MEVPGHITQRWKAIITLKHRNGRKLEEHVTAGDILDLTIVEGKFTDGEIELEIDLALEVEQTPAGKLELEKLPLFARHEISHKVDSFNRLPLTYDVHAVLRDGDEVVAFDDESPPNDLTRVFTDSSCPECGEQVAADVSYCPDCGAPQD